jgi:hypothetical protein
VVKAAELQTDTQQRHRVADRRIYFLAMADDPRIKEKGFPASSVEGGDRRWIEVSEGLAISFSPLEDGEPTEPRLRSFQHEKLKVPSVSVNRHSPL